MATNRFGFWIDVTDPASAREAICMAGLPMAMIGLNCLVVALVPETADWIVPSVLAGFGFVLLLIGFQLRGGRGFLLPIGSLITIPVLVLQIAVAPILFALFPILALLLAVSGVRGWIWLRRHDRVDSQNQ